MKRGIATSEFWISLLVVASPGLVLMVENMQGTLEPNGNALIAAILAATVAAFKYISSRTDLKKNGGSK